MDSLPEPWLRGPIAGIDPLLAPVLYTFQQAREDLRRWTEGFSAAQLWAAPHSFGSVGFHIRHIRVRARDLPAGADRDELLAPSLEAPTV